MAGDFTGKALDQLSDLLTQAEFPLAQYVPEESLDSVFEGLYYTDAEAFSTPDGNHLVLTMVFEGQIILSPPGILDIALIIGTPGQEWTSVGAEFLIGPEPYARLDEVPLAIRLKQAILKPMVSMTEMDEDTPGLEITLGTVSLTVYQEGFLSDAVISVSIPLCMIGNTGILIEAGNVRPILGMADQMPSGLDLSFRGFFSGSARLYWLPQAVMNGVSGLRLDFEALAIGPEGVSFDLTQTWQLNDDGRHILGTSELAGYLFESGWELGISQVTATVRQNLPVQFDLAGKLRIPCFDALFEAGLGLGAEGDNYTVALSLAWTGDSASIDLGAGSLTIHRLLLSGMVSGNGFNLEGSVGGTLDLAPLTLDFDNVTIRVEHSLNHDRFSVGLSGLDLGPLGVVETAMLLITSTVTDTGTLLNTVGMEITMAWQDVKQRLDLGQLPDRFPLPPDDALVTVYLNWEEEGDGYKLLFRIEAELSGPGSLYMFIPEEFRPETRNVRFTFAASYSGTADFMSASASEPFSGNISVKMELRLPKLPDISGAGLFSIDTEKWVEARVTGGIRSDGNSETGFMELAISGELTVGINLPGLPQTQPPIEIAVTGADFDLSAGATEELSGRFTLEGSFSLHPIDPAGNSLPVPPFMASHMARLFRSAGLTEVTGDATFDFRFMGDRSVMDLTCQFKDAGMDIDLFDMVSGLTRGMTGPEGMNSGSGSIDLDITVSIRLRRIGIRIGSLEDTAAGEGRFSFELALDLSFGVFEAEEFRFSLSDEEFSFGFAKLEIPIALPHFPVSLSDLNQLRGPSRKWDYEGIWLAAAEPALNAEIKALKKEVDSLKEEIEAAAPEKKAKLQAGLRQTRKDLFEKSGRKFLIESIFVFHQLVGAPNRASYQSLVEWYLGLMDATLHQFSFDTKLNFVMRDVQFVLPFHDPTDIRVEGGGQLSGFPPDDPLAPLGDLVFKLGISADAVYFSVEGGDPVPVPVFGQYRNEAGEEEAKVSIKLSHARIGYGYTKNALHVALAGELKIAGPLADDLNTAGTIGIGVRLPERSRLGFTLDLIPVTLGEVDFLLPLFDFDIDMRREFSPGISDSATCDPYWDGLQLIAPGIMRHDIKRSRFTPFFGPLPAPNYNLSFDIMLGDARNGITYVCNEYRVILSTSLFSVIPMLTDGTPFFDNLCINIRVAGFRVSFNLQRPFPSMSPLALFEIFGLLADPMMPVDPDGHLAGIIRATIEDARITLPPSVVRMFPEMGPVIGKEVNHTINLGTVITLAQAVAGPALEVLKQAEERAEKIWELLEEVKENPPEISAAALLALLPPEMRTFHLHGSLAGFDASATFVLLTAGEAAAEFRRRDNPGRAVSPRAPKKGKAVDPAWLMRFQPDYSGPSIPVHLPHASANNVLLGEEFEPFDAKSLKEIPLPGENAAGILFAARVKLLEHQVYRFLGYLFDDGSFSLISTLDLKPLMLSVAGIPVPLPLKIQGRLMLSGRSGGADSFAKITAKAWGAWEPFPDLIQVNLAGKKKPATLEFRSDGRFLIRGSGELLLFRGAASVSGSAEISHDHCYLKGRFQYYDHPSPSRRKIDLSFDGSGRIGPGRDFAFSGQGKLLLLGNSITDLRCSISDRGAAVEGLVETRRWNWGTIPVNEFRLGLKGAMDITGPDAPRFLLEGDAYLRAFGTSKKKTGLEISGRGGIKGENGKLTAFVEGALFWQGQEWLDGRIDMGHDSVAVRGHTAFALDLTPSELPGGIEVANLFFRVDLGGSLSIAAGGGLEKCELDVDWLLGVRLPGTGMEQQVFPIVLQKSRIRYPRKRVKAGAASKGKIVELADLITVKSDFFLPFGTLPDLKPGEGTAVYWYLDSQASDLNYKKLVVNPEDPTDGDYTHLKDIPRSVGDTGETVDIAEEIKNAFNLSFPSASVKIPKYGVTDSWKFYLKDEGLPIPMITTDKEYAASHKQSGTSVVELFTLPTVFGPASPLLQGLNFSLALAWKNGRLGLAVSGPKKKSKMGKATWETKFIAFDRSLSGG